MQIQQSKFFLSLLIIESTIPLLPTRPPLTRGGRSPSTPPREGLHHQLVLGQVFRTQVFPPLVRVDTQTVQGVEVGAVLANNFLWSKKGSGSGEVVGEKH